MGDGVVFAAAASALSAARGRGDDLSSPFVVVVGVTGAVVSTLGDPLGSETLSASDERAARLDEIQIDLGEGPCWQALSTRRPVLEADLGSTSNGGWPLALQEMRGAGFGAVFAFPMIVGTIPVGAVDLYSDTPGPLSETQVRDAGLLAAILARKVLGWALLTADTVAEEGEVQGVFSRREEHQATGMLIAQLRVSAADAHLVLRGHAYATGRSVLDVATDVLNRHLDFTDTPTV
ncbi:GAF and ANTAR domain-containing protein [Frondihabitans sp. PAMC 28766]|uniref:GAF and ANTAR domain-containing protein n=1 Tax=Frondihabitans sp. PAMC 28766 TaxID=1795630 RepID=UPI0012FF605C|nr:GAF and ANTAR domain-containing protein [Frondihabitans sp. PAMC 28766]